MARFSPDPGKAPGEATVRNGLLTDCHFGAQTASRDDGGADQDGSHP
jgi:hypothetical protein